MPLTAAQIVTLATQVAKCPSYTSQAGQFLNAILQDLAQTYDFETVVKTYSFNFVLSTVSGPGNQYAAGCGRGLVLHLLLAVALVLLTLPYDRVRALLPAFAPCLFVRHFRYPLRQVQPTRLLPRQR